MNSLNLIETTNPTGRSMRCVKCGKDVKVQKQWTGVKLPDGRMITGYGYEIGQDFPEGSIGVIFGYDCFSKLEDK